MAPSKKKRIQKSSRIHVSSDFDSEGVRNALLAALTCVYEKFPHVTLPQFLVALEVMVAERDGEPHTLATLVEKLNMPFSTASRVVWSLTQEGGEIGVIKYKKHATDRRKKLLIMDTGSLNRSMPRTVIKAMVDYYGPSVKKLSRAH